MGTIDEIDFLKKGTFFPVVTRVHDFVFVRKGWKQLNLFLDRYNMVESHARFIDPEGFYDLLRERTNATRTVQQFYYPDDVIRNVFSLQE